MNLRTIQPYIVIGVLAMPVIFHLFRPGFFITDDGDWMIIRFSAFYQELRQGQFPVRWLNRLNNGYGYPVATFLYPGFMYLASFAKVLGLGFVSSVKSVMVVSVLAGAVFCYKWIRTSMSYLASIFAAVCYLYHPYLLWDIYTRGSVGEVLALGIVPISLYAVAQRKYSILAVSYAAVIVSHNSLALLFVPLLFSYHAVKEFVVLQMNTKALIRVFGTLLLGLGLSSFFWIPALVELPLTVFSDVSVSAWQEYFIGGGVGAADEWGRMGNYFLLAPVQIVLSAAALILVLFGKIYRSRDLLLMLFFFWGSVFLATPLSKIIWQILPIGTIVQFPFRFLALGVVTGAYIGAVIFDQMLPSAKSKSYSLLLGALLFAIPAYYYLQPDTIVRDESYYSTNEATTTVRDEYMPRWVSSVPVARASEKYTRVSDETVHINTIYWPGFTAYVNGEPVPISHDNEEGVMAVTSFSDTDEIAVTLEESSERIVANGISIASAAALLYLAFGNKFYGNRQ